jgi:hypothetical protein
MAMAMASAAYLSDPGPAQPTSMATAMQAKTNTGATVIVGIREAASCRTSDRCAFINLTSAV